MPDSAIVAGSQRMRPLRELKRVGQSIQRGRLSSSVKQQVRRYINPEKPHTDESGRCPSPGSERMEFGIKDSKVTFLGYQNPNLQLKGQ